MSTLKRILVLILFVSIIGSIFSVIGILHVTAEPVNEYVWGYPGTGRGNLNPFIATGIDSVVSGLLYSTSLIWIAPNGSIIPWLAYKWEFISNANNTTTIVFHLKNATWSDGAFVTADDFIFTWRKLYLPFNATLDPYKIWKNVVSVQKDSNSVFKVIVNRNNTFIFSVVAGRIAVPSKVWAPVIANMTQSDFSKFVIKPGDKILDVTCGPFTLEYYDPQTEIVLKANAKFFIGSPHIDRFRIKLYQSTQSLIPAIIKGEIDSAYFSPTDVPTVSGIPGIKVEPMPYSNNIFYLWTNNKVYPTSLKDFRIALSLAINRKILADRAGGGFGTPKYNFIPPVAEPYWLNTSVNGTNAVYDPDKANKILDSLGFTKGSDGIRVTPNGTRLSFNLDVPSISDWLTAVQLIASDLKKIGIDVTIRIVSIPTYVDIRSKGAFTIFFGSRIYSIMMVYDPANYLFYPVFHSASTAPIGSSTPGTNYARVVDSQLDTLIDNARNTDNPSEYKNYIYQIQQVLHNNMYIIPLYSIYDIKVYRSDRIEGIQIGLQTVDTLLSVRVKGLQTTTITTTTTTTTTTSVTTTTTTMTTTTMATTTTTSAPSGIDVTLIIAGVVIVIIVIGIGIIVIRRK